MLRPAFIWILFLVCAVAVITALSLLTRHAIAVEKAGREAATEADLADRTRFALWRMDTSASSLLAVENNRSPAQFSAFSTNGNAETFIPSPLLKEIPDYALLYFEISESGAWSSPQVPDPANTQPAIEAGADLQRMEFFARLLKQLKNKVPAARLQVEQKSTNDTDTAQMATPSDLEAIQETPIPQSLKNESTVELLAKDQRQRALVVEQATRRGEYAQNVKALPEKTLPLASAPRRNVADAAPALATTAAPQEARRQLNEIPAQSRLAEDIASADSGFLDFTPYAAAWVNGELLLYRHVEQNGSSRVQGVWLNATGLNRSLLAAVHDILPSAQLLPAELNRTSPLGLIALPYQLSPGSAPALDPARLPRPVLDFLILAWSACLVMLLVAGILIAGVLQLGERRATFVSSVTHELRTPLTTFQLYAEMLAEKMVPEERRQEYLRTLHREAGRLSHLVENVLAYSRIERGSARAKTESISVSALLAGIVPRLRERASAEHLEFATSVTSTTGNVVLKTDATAVEQILFNLTDNACKYAASHAMPKRLELSVATRGRQIIFSLRDFGPGVSQKEQRKLFRPFHKSATEAAHSKPGVGLGLALSRRLAKALGGNLTYEAASPGSRFLLTLHQAF